MTQAEALAELSRRCQADAGTVLSTADLVAILAKHLRYSTYAVSTEYSFGDKVGLGGDDANGRVYRCLIGGTSGATDAGPSWPDSTGAFTGQVFGDGTGYLLWEDVGPDVIGNYDMSGAERDGWLLKAAKCAGDVDFGDKDSKISASQESASYQRRANLVSGAWVA